MTTAVFTKVENKAKLKKVKQEAAEQKATVERATAKLLTVKTISDKHEARVAEVQQELKGAITKCEDLELKSKGQGTKMFSMKLKIQEARTET